MIEKFQYYLDKGLARKVSVDLEEAKSLMNKAALRVEYVKRQSSSIFNVVERLQTAFS